MALNFTFVCNPKNYKCDNPNCPPIHAFTPLLTRRFNLKHENYSAWNTICNDLYCTIKQCNGCQLPNVIG